MIVSLIFVLVHAPADLAQVALRSEKRLSEARTLFRTNCQRCHGNSDGTAAPRKRLSSIPDFSSPSWHQRRGDQQLLISILDGKGSSMPPFRDRLGSDQAHELVFLIRTFNPKSSKETGDVRDDFDGRFLRLQKEFERLNLEFKALSNPSQH